jgi:D-beta-D-heptose 7-phosphate kinase/D-beta-D-heptose 1-phosphate adenosyltransferase
MLPPLSRARASALIARFPNLPVLVIGDVMLDRFIVGHVARISPEAPVPIVRFHTEHTRLGGAANVAHNIVALGARPSLVGMVGADAAAARLKDQLAAVGIDTDGLIVDPGRPTTEKVRVVTERNQQVARIDYEGDADATRDVEQGIVEAIERLGQGALGVLVSDYLKGTLTPRVMRCVAALAAGSQPGQPPPARPGIPLLVDPKIPHLNLYAGATLVTPNHHEAEAATHLRVRDDEEARAAARDFRGRAQCEAVLITRGEQGMWLSAGTVEGSIQSVAREVSDVTGAGDTVVATLGLALAAGATIAEAAMLANVAAGIVVGKFGPATVSRDELLAALAAPNQIG